MVWMFAVAGAQELELPALSPSAMVQQQVGVVELTVEYSSPGKRDRAVWGELVPYGEVWRTGANATTTFETTGDVTIGGAVVPAGKYGLFSIPGKDEWTVILSNVADGSPFAYDVKDDRVRVTVKPQEGPARERMTFVFSDTTETATSLDLEWAGVRVALPVTVDTPAMVNAAIGSYVEGAGGGLARAGRYKAEHGDLPGALKLLDASLAIEETWYNVWLKADALHQQADHKNAYKLATRAMELGTAAGDDEFFWKDRVEKALAEWKKK
ncbi:MAG: DUF2911 domain-containing protein [Myxococcota bacterium]